MLRARGTVLRERFSVKVFTPPPNWPAPPPGWRPPPTWQPDPEWGPPPPGWRLWTRRNPHAFPTAIAFGGVPLLVLLGWNVLFSDQVKLFVLAADVVTAMVPALVCGTLAHFSPWRFRWWAYLGLIIAGVVLIIMAVLALFAAGLFVAVWVGWIG